jgi:hypothetical protein
MAVTAGGRSGNRAFFGPFLEYLYRIFLLLVMGVGQEVEVGQRRRWALKVEEEVGICAE